MRRLAVVATLCSLVAGSSAIAASSPANQARLDRTVRYLQQEQQPSGGFGKAGEPSQISSAWTALALAAAGINPQDQALPGGTDAYAFLVSRYREGVEESECAPIACTTTLERELMVVNAAGTSPRDFAGVDLAGELLARARADGSFPHVPGGQAGVNDTVFAILALAPLQSGAAQAAVQGAADWVQTAQQDSGGWSWRDRNSPAEVDMTGAAIQALVAAGRAGTEPVQEGLEYLRKAQNPDGGLPALPGDPESNVASTAWAVQAIWAVGDNPETWLTGSGEETEEPLDFLESLQEPDGHIRWKRSQDLNGVWMTAYVAPAFAGQAWPIPAAPRTVRRPMPPTQAGQGGGSGSGPGVIAGGGGGGAPLFSRPRPQSKGRTPGGARVIHGEPRASRNHSETRRGENTVQPTGTASAEADDKTGGSDSATGSKGDGGGASSGGSSAASSSEMAAGAGSGGSGSRAARELSARGRSGEGGSGRRVIGTLVGASAGGPREGALAFGAPGLHSAGVDADAPWLAIAIAAAAVLLGLVGSQWERRRGELFA